MIFYFICYVLSNNHTEKSQKNYYKLKKQSQLKNNDYTSSIKIQCLQKVDSQLKNKSPINKYTLCPLSLDPSMNKYRIKTEKIKTVDDMNPFIAIYSNGNSKDESQYAFHVINLQQAVDDGIIMSADDKVFPLQKRLYGMPEYLCMTRINNDL